MKKRFVLVVLAALLASSVLFAQAAAEQKKEGPIEITFWSLFTGGVRLS